MTVAAETSVRILADHSALLAIPAFIPALLVAGVVFYVARRDRRQGDDGTEDTDSDSATAGQEGTQ